MLMVTPPPWPIGRSRYKSSLYSNSPPAAVTSPSGQSVIPHAESSVNDPSPEIGALPIVLLLINSWAIVASCDGVGLIGSIGDGASLAFDPPHCARADAIKVSKVSSAHVARRDPRRRKLPCAGASIDLVTIGAGRVRLDPRTAVCRMGPLGLWLRGF